MTKVEEVARAIDEANGIMTLTGKPLEKSMRLARAVIKAMRVPSAGMVEAAHATVGPGFCDEPADSMNFAEAWDAAIDAALQEGA